MKIISSILVRTALLASVGAVLYFYRAQIFVVRDHMYAVYAPCTRPLAYSLGSFDSRFGISEKTFLADITAAEAIWEGPVGRDLFVNEPDGAMKINLVYDYRQAATKKLRALGLVVNDDRASYDALLAKYNSLTKEYAPKKAALSKEIVNFEAQQKAYEAEVASWNAKGGAPKDVYDRLSAEEVVLTNKVAEIKIHQDALNVMVDTTNALVTVINRVASSLNVAATQFNNIGKERGQEFEAGVYQLTPTNTKIDIYEFDDNQKLVKVLAHELGHALGLEHVEDQTAIMYSYNQGEKNKLSETDIKAIKQKCDLK